MDPVFKRRTRMVTFRLDDEEYESLKALCVAGGSRSVSDFARMAVSNMLDRAEQEPADGIQSTLADLSRSIRQLDEDVKTLTCECTRLSTAGAVGSPDQGGGSPDTST